MDFLKKHRPVILLWGISCAAGLLAVGVVIFAAEYAGLDPVRLTGDAKGYVQLAENLYEHGVFSFSTASPYVPDSFRAPGYPAFLSTLYALAHNWLAVLLLQALLMSVAPVLLYLLLRRYHERAAWWGSFAFAFEPIRLYASSTMLSDALFVCVFLGALLLLAESLRRPLYWATVAGFMLGLAALVRPIAQFLPLLFILYIVAARVSWKRAVILSVVLLLGFCAAVLPWMVRNHTLFNQWSLSSVGSYNLAFYNAPEYVKYRPTAEGEEILRNFAARQETLSGEERISLARSEEFSNVFWNVVREREIDYAFFHLFKTIPFFLTDGLRDTVRLFGVELGAPQNITTALLHGDIAAATDGLRRGGLAAFLLVLGSGFWVCVCAGWLYFLYRAIKNRHLELLVLCAGVVLYFALLTGPVSNARYRLPVEGFLLVSAAAVVLKRHEA